MDLVQLKNAVASDEAFKRIEVPEGVVEATDRGINPDSFIADAVINAADQYRMTNRRRDAVDAMRGALLEKAAALYPQHAEEYRRMRDLAAAGRDQSR